MCVQMADAEDKLRKTKDKTLTLVTQDSRVGVRASVRKKYEGKASKVIDRACLIGGRVLTDERHPQAGEMFQVARKRRCMSRNKYLLSLASSNHAMEKFFNVELVDFLEVNNRKPVPIPSRFSFRFLTMITTTDWSDCTMRISQQKGPSWRN